MARLDEFKKIFEDFGAISGFAMAGSVVAPLLASASGLAPPWPENLEFVASVMILLTMAVIFQFLPKRRSGYTKVFIAGATMLVTMLAAQVYLNTRFVTAAPGLESKLLMGCGWTRDMQRIAKKDPDSFDLVSQCPGDYRTLLEMADNDPSQIWTASSIDQIGLLLAATWVLIFVAFALALGSFVTYNARQRATT